MSEAIYTELQRIMREKKIKAPELAEKAGLASKQNIYDIQRAKKIDLDILIKLANALEVNVSRLLRGVIEEKDLLQTNEPTVSYDSAYKQKYLNALEEVSELKSYVIELQKKVITLTESK